MNKNKMILDQVARGYTVDLHDLKAACKWALEEIAELEENLDWWKTCGDEI